MIEKMLDTKKLEKLIIGLFILSGFSGLIYLVAWTHLFEFSLGPKYFSIVSVFIIFLGGQALGSYFIGFFIDKRNDLLKIFCILEGLLGIYCLLLPWLSQGTVPILGFIYKNLLSSFYTSLILRYLTFNSLFLIPTILLGATWPVISKLLVLNLDNLGWTMGKVFGANAIWGFFGLLAAQQLLRTPWGVKNIIIFGATINLIICIFSLILYKWVVPIKGRPIERIRRKSTPKKAFFNDAKEYESMRLIILIGFSFCCLAVIVYQFAWLKALSIFLNSTFSAFLLLLSTLLLGTASGSIGLGVFIDKRKDPLLVFGLIQIFMGCSFAAIVPFIKRYPLFITIMMNKYANSLFLVQSISLILLFFILWIPTLLLGFAFPLICKLYANNFKKIGKSISSVFSIYVLGGSLGILFVSVFLIPWFKINIVITLMFWLSILIGSIFLLLSCSVSKAKKVALFVLVIGTFIGSSLFLPLWKLSFLNGAQHKSLFYENVYNDEEGLTLKYGLWKKKRLFSKKGFIESVLVTKERDDIYLYVNNKNLYSTKDGLSAEVLSGHIPMIFHKNPNKILHIGNRGGITLGAIEYHPVNEIDYIDISRWIIETSKYFHKFNNNAINDPRLKVIIEDAGYYLRFTDKKYDVIISQPTAFWPWEISDFWSKEFFQLCSQRLKSGGIVAVRLPLKELSSWLFKPILCSWHEVFPFVELWETDIGKNYLLIGSKSEIVWHYPQLTDRLREENISAQLSFADIKTNPYDFLSLYFLDKEGIISFSSDSEAFRRNSIFGGAFPQIISYDEKIVDLLEEIEIYRGIGLNRRLSDIEGIETTQVKDIIEKVDKAMKTKKYIAKAHIYLLKKEERQKILNALKEAMHINPSDSKAIKIYCDNLLEVAEDYTNQKQFDLALWSFKEIFRLMPDNIKAHYLLGKNYYNMGLIDQAITEYEKAVEGKPDNEEIYCHLAIAYLNKGWIDLSISQFNHSIRINTDYAEPHLYLGVAYFKKDLIDQAIEEYKKALALQANYVDAHYNLGIAYLKQGLVDKAALEWKEAIRIRPKEVNSRYNLAVAYFNHGQIEESIILLEELLGIKPDFSRAKSLLNVLYQMRGK